MRIVSRNFAKLVRSADLTHKVSNLKNNKEVLKIILLFLCQTTFRQKQSAAHVVTLVVTSFKKTIYSYYL